MQSILNKTGLNVMEAPFPKGARGSPPARSCSDIVEGWWDECALCRLGLQAVGGLSGQPRTATVDAFDGGEISDTPSVRRIR
jgi:hypothetical protein